MQAPTGQTIASRVLVNLDRCIECGSCGAACSLSHGNMPAMSFARSGPALLPIVCRQCKAASCVATCPADAMVRDEAGVVRRRLFRCIGCGSCARACPFGVLSSFTHGIPAGFRSPSHISGHQIAKCDLCADRVEGGTGFQPVESRHSLKDCATPRCVAACPAGALVFADERDTATAGLTVLGGRTTGDHPFKRR